MVVLRGRVIGYSFKKIAQSAAFAHPSVGEAHNEVELIAPFCWGLGAPFANVSTRETGRLDTRLAETVPASEPVGNGLCGVPRRSAVLGTDAVLHKSLRPAAFPEGLGQPPPMACIRMITESAGRMAARVIAGQSEFLLFTLAQKGCFDDYVTWT